MTRARPTLPLGLAGALVLALPAAAQHDHGAPPPAAAESRAPLFPGLGSFHRAITTASADAGRYFDQGLLLSYGFNHAEAARSFRQAAALDPGCVACWWGLALVLGPNINAAMDPAANDEAWSASRQALRLAAGASPVERALAEALAVRYAAEPAADRSPLDRDYADAMRGVATSFPDDPDVLVLFAEALMDTMPWDYWRDGEPRPETREVLAALERARAIAPLHPGALHFVIHATEAGPDPSLGERAADLLGDVAPGAGHLVHMPSHTYMRIGRYHDATVANQLADRADDDYVAACHAQGSYPLAYHPHNKHFLWAAATMEGRSAVALRAADDLAAKLDASLLGDPAWPTVEYYFATPLFARVRFRRWDELLAAPSPRDDLRFATAVWHYARGRAAAARGRLAEADAHLAGLEAVLAEGSLEGRKVWDAFNTLTSLLAVAREDLGGHLAAARGDAAAAIALLRRAVELEDALVYDEPPDWHYPMRQALGALLLAAGRAEEAGAAFAEDLAKHPENGWSLWGLAESLAARGESAAAEEARARFAAAWRWADVTLGAAPF